MADNVTPFRPRRPPPRPVQRGGGVTSPRGKAVLTHILTLAGFGLSFFWPAPPLAYLAMAVGIAAVAIAFSNRADTMPWAQTHHEHALRTLMIGYAIWVLSGLLLFAGAGLLGAVFWIRVAVLAWVALRAGVGLVMAIVRRPIPNPRGPLI